MEGYTYSESTSTEAQREPTLATKANTKPGNALSPARDDKGAILHLGQSRLNNLGSEGNKFRQKVSNLKDGEQCHNEARVLQKGRNAKSKP